MTSCHANIELGPTGAGLSTRARLDENNRGEKVNTKLLKPEIKVELLGDRIGELRIGFADSGSWQAAAAVEPVVGPTKVTAPQAKQERQETSFNYNTRGMTAS